MKNIEFISLDNEELRRIDGGVVVEVIGIAIGYACWAASFCYQLGKD